MEGLMKTLMTTLGSAAWAELSLAWGVDGDVLKLRSRMSTINAVLGEAEARATNDGALLKWLADLEEVAFDAEDALDALQTEAALQEGREGKVLCCLFYYFSNLLFRNKMARSMKDIVQRFDEAAEERRKFHLAERSTAVLQPDRVEVPFQVEDAEIFGRDDDKEKVMERLTQADGDIAVTVLPIVGLGGMGKTTLARWVYNDERTVEHFGKNRMWVCVGEVFDLDAILKAMLDGVPGAHSGMSRQRMHDLIQKEVTDKRYLLILDDVWSEDVSQWEGLKNMLRGGAHGSKVVVTTRSHNVATIVGTTMGTAWRAHKLEGLTDDDCWMLFKQRAFGPGRAAESPQLVKIGKGIVRRCGGLPLAAKSLGGLMATKTHEGEWLAIEISDIWNLDGGVGRILPALKLSYDHLSPQLKRCFTYCSVFPKDYKIQKLRLVHLWMSQGFIQSDGGMNLEDIGTQCFNTLLNRSFFQDEEGDEYGDIESCKMHDLVHDLACFVAKDESSIVEADGRISLPQGCRYSSIIYPKGSSPSIVEIASEANKVRSFFLLSESGYASERKEFDDTKFLNEISKLTRLRALHLDCISGGNILGVLGELKHLRFLELSSLKVEALPDSITDLRNLQTLNLGECKELKELPESMMMMINLRHLVMKNCKSLAGMPRGIGRLTNLQTLSVFYVGREESHASIAELRNLNQIKGKLAIDGLSNVKDPTDAIEASLCSKSGLLALVLNWGHDSRASASDVDVLENLQPHLNLKSLSMSYYRGSRLPNWFTNLPSSSLPNLVRLRLEDLRALEELPPLGQLPSLKELDLYRMDAIKKVGKEMYVESALASAVPVFPSLKRMSMYGAEELEEWWVPERGAFTSLEHLKIKWCPKLRTLSSMPSQLRDNVECGRGREVDGQKQPPHSFLSLSHLKIGGCDSLAVLPEWLRGIVSLQYLRLTCLNLQTLPEWIQQLSGLKTLEIGFCRNLRMLPDGIQHLSRLEELEIGECPNLEMLPDGIQHLSRLQRLHLSGCPNLRMLPDGIQHLSGLVELHIKVCNNLRMLPDGIQHLSGLQRLNLYWCHNLQMLPDGIQHLSGLEDLSINGCPNLQMLPDGIQHLSGLRRLHLSGCHNLRVLPDGIQHLSGLEALSINGCDNLRMLPDGIQHLSGLRSLHLSSLPKLRMLPDGFQHLSGLQSLHLSGLPKLRMLPDWIQHLLGLQILHLSGCPKLRMLPDGFQHLSRLQRLHLSGCPNLEMLPDAIPHLSRLQILRLSGCRNLRMLPDGIQHLSGLKELEIGDFPNLQMLPDGIQHLSRLELLRIRRCRHLKGRCERETGEDWFKISHIPHVSYSSSSY